MFFVKIRLNDYSFYFQNKIENAKDPTKRKRSVLTEVDSLVMDIIGEGPEVPDIKIEKAWSLNIDLDESESEVQEIDDSEHIEQIVTGDDFHYLNDSADRTEDHIIHIDSPSKTSNQPTSDQTHQSLNDLSTQFQKEKMRLELEYLRIRNHKAKMEILRMEVEMNLPRSDFTLQLPGII